MGMSYRIAVPLRGQIYIVDGDDGCIAVRAGHGVDLDDDGVLPYRRVPTGVLFCC